MTLSKLQKPTRAAAARMLKCNADTTLSFQHEMSFQATINKMLMQKFPHFWLHRTPNKQSLSVMNMRLQRLRSIERVKVIEQRQKQRANKINRQEYFLLFMHGAFTGTLLAFLLIMDHGRRSRTNVWNDCFYLRPKEKLFSLWRC